MGGGVDLQNKINNLLQLPTVKCEFEELNAKYQMHLRLRELACLPDTPDYPPVEISAASHCLSKYLEKEIYQILLPYYVTLMRTL